MHERGEQTNRGRLGIKDIVMQPQGSASVYLSTGADRVLLPSQALKTDASHVDKP